MTDDHAELSLQQVEALCEVSELEARLLRSAESPIVLLRKRKESLPGALVSVAVAPAPNPYLGVMLPYTPLHHLLMAELGFPIIATSGNLSDEPICTDEREALERLRGIADVFLVHNRPIVRHVDDSIVRVMGGREMVMRRARGYAPLPVSLQKSEVRSQKSEVSQQTDDGRRMTDDGQTIDDGRRMTDDGQSSIVNRQSEIPNPKSKIPRVLAVGAHLKNAVAVSIGHNVFISQHIGDLETAQAHDAFRRVIDNLSTLYEFQPDVVACDLHPDYLSTQFAEAYAQQRGLPLVKVQHHAAHVASCMAENELTGRVLGVSWDGTGYGTDGAIWGGEFLATQMPGASFQRVAHLRPFRLPGGDKAVKEPRRVALGVLHEVFGEAAWEMDDLAPVAAFSPAEQTLIRQMLRQGVNAPVTTSAGRLFDAVASLAGLRQRLNYEGQAAMELEFAIGDLQTDEAYPFTIAEESRLQNTDYRIQIDWAPLIRAVIEDARTINRQSSIVNRQLSLVAARFHNALVEMMVAVARRVNEPRVVLTGGCFQNRYLLERAIRRLHDEGFRPYWHQRVSPNDGGIALGQAAAAF